jgi:hypothetical protein
VPSLRLALSLLVGDAAPRRAQCDIAGAAGPVLGALARRLRPVYDIRVESQVGPRPAFPSAPLRPSLRSPRRSRGRSPGLIIPVPRPSPCPA